MDFTAMTSLTGYTRLQSMKTKFESKKATGNLRQKEVPENSEEKSWKEKKLAEDQAILQSYLESEERRDKVMEGITDKIAAGGKLTSDEMEYVRRHNPEVYQRLKNEETEQKTYEKRLESAKTKEEAQQVKADRAAANLAVVNAVKNNPNIPEGAKLAIYAAINRKTKKEAELFAKFVKSGQYNDLPTEAEKREIERAIKEEQQLQVESDAPKGNERDSDEENSVASDSNKTPEDAEVTQNSVEDKTAQHNVADLEDGRNAVRSEQPEKESNAGKPKELKLHDPEKIQNVKNPGKRKKINWDEAGTQTRTISFDLKV